MQTDTNSIERALYGYYCQVRKDYNLTPLPFDEMKAVQESNGHWEADMRRMRAAVEAI